MASGRVPIDIVLLQVTGPDAAGNFNAGLGIEHLQEAMARARLVIAQLNPDLPWTEGDTLIEPGLIDILVRTAHPPLELPASADLLLSRSPSRESVVDFVSTS